MSVPRQIRNVALAGFMGVGKSSVGRLVAAELQFEFVDTDEVIESRTGAKVSEIFVHHGEAAFRQFESELVAEMAAWDQRVISTGGGLIVNPENLARLKTHSLVVCLWATPETIYQRTKHQTHRPLLQTPNPLANIRALLAAREAAYKQSDVLVNTEQRSLKEIAQHVLHNFRAARHTPPRL
ncbi:MAG: Shikimate kinase [Verrucomicrobiota bacterium]|jgi:shikimate kinase